MHKLFTVAVFVMVTPLLAVAQGTGTLDAIKNRGHLQCGISQGVPGFSSQNPDGSYSGIDVDYCNALGAAIFGTAEAVRFTALSARERFTALQSGEIDVLSRNTTWTATRDATLGVHFVGVTYYDGQGFITRRGNEIRTVKELEGASICTQLGTTTELNLADYFRTNNLEYNLVAFDRINEVLAAYETERCDAFTADLSALAAHRTQFQDPSAHILLPEVISKEPLGPLVRQGDDSFYNLAKWVLFALIEAEELGVTQENVAQMLTSTNPNIRRLLGVEGEIGAALGVSPDWGVNVIKAVGNYGEMFERNLGTNTPVGLERGLNALWFNGGLMYAMPMR